MQGDPGLTPASVSRKRVLEVIGKLRMTDLETQLPALLQVLPQPQVSRAAL